MSSKIYLTINGKKRNVSIKKYSINGELNVSSTLISKDYWINFPVSNETNIEETIINMFDNMIKYNKKNKKKNEKQSLVCSTTIILKDIIIEEPDGKFMLGTLTK